MTSMLVLALDTSSAAVTAAVHDGEDVRAVRSVLDPRRQAELLAPVIAEVLAAAGITVRELTAVVTGVGPGPFTGLRVGIVTATVLASALTIPVYGVCSLDATAEAAARQGLGTGPDREFLVAGDARRREVYWARYACPDRFAVRVAGPFVTAPTAVARDGLPVVGRGTALYPEVLGPVSDLTEPSAGDLARRAVRALGSGSDSGVLLPPEPLYLRRPDAVAAAERKRVLQ